MSARTVISCALLVIAAYAQAATAQTVTLDVKGMTCPTCPLTVQVALKKQPGVEEVKMDARHNTARVIFDPAKVSAERLAKAVTDAGYPATARR